MVRMIAAEDPGGGSGHRPNARGLRVAPCQSHAGPLPLTTAVYEFPPPVAVLIPNIRRALPPFRLVRTSGHLRCQRPPWPRSPLLDPGASARYHTERMHPSSGCMVRVVTGTSQALFGALQFGTHRSGVRRHGLDRLRCWRQRSTCVRRFEQSCRGRAQQRSRPSWRAVELLRRAVRLRARYRRDSRRRQFRRVRAIRTMWRQPAGSWTEDRIPENLRSAGQGQHRAA